MLFVGERRQSRRLPGAIRSERERATNRGKNASAPFSSVRRRAIPDARSWILQLLAHRARFELLAPLAAIFAGSPPSSTLAAREDQDK